MKKKIVKLDYKKLFTEPWCPLFGSLPDDFLFHSMISRCVSIIYSARLNWGVLDECKGNSYPTPEKTGYQKETLLTARAIFKNIARIRYEAHYPGYEQPDNPFIDKWFNVINYETEGVMEEVSELKIFSLLAIDFAWDVIKDVSYKGIPENNETVLRRILFASNLLSRADSYMDAFISSDQINTLDQKIEEMKPDHKSNEKRREWLKKNRELKMINAKKKRGEWLKIALKIRNRNKRLSRRGIAIKVLEKIDPSLKEKQYQPERQPNYRMIYDTIRKNNV